MPAQAAAQDPIVLGQFTGLDNKNLPLDVGLGGLVQADNIVLDRFGRASTRPGRTLTHAGTPVFYSDGATCLFLDGGTLHRQNADGRVDALGPLAGSRRLVFKTIPDGRVLIHTDRAQAVLRGNALRPLGVPPPSGLEIIINSGRLEAGNYLVTATEVAEDGRESAALPLRSVTVEEGAGLIFVPSVSPGRQGRIYLSAKNGRVVYWYADGNWVSCANVADTLPLTSPCLRQYLGGFPAADHMAWIDGHFWVAAGDTLYRSPPYDEEICDLTANRELDGPITMLRSVDTGLFVSTVNQLYWMPGGDPAATQAVWTHNEPAIPGTDRSVNLNRVGTGGMVAKGCLFCTPSGVALGLPEDGTVILKTWRQLRLPDGIKGATAAQFDNFYILTLRF